MNLPDTPEAEESKESGLDGAAFFILCRRNNGKFDFQREYEIF